VFFDLYINWISKHMKTFFYNGGEKGMMVVFFSKIHFLVKKFSEIQHN
jgi:hypothetical protein